MTGAGLEHDKLLVYSTLVYKTSYTNVNKSYNNNYSPAVGRKSQKLANVNVVFYLFFQGWLGSLKVTCRTCNPEVTQRRVFDSAPGHCRVKTLGKLFTHMCLCHQAV